MILMCYFAPTKKNKKGRSNIVCGITSRMCTSFYLLIFTPCQVKNCLASDQHCAPCGWSEEDNEKDNRRVMKYQIGYSNPVPGSLKLRIDKSRWCPSCLGHDILRTLFHH